MLSSPYIYICGVSHPISSYSFCTETSLVVPVAILAASNCIFFYIMFLLLSAVVPNYIGIF